jgi:hypothetical protein
MERSSLPNKLALSLSLSLPRSFPHYLCGDDDEEEDDLDPTKWRMEEKTLLFVSFVSAAGPSS